MDNFPDDILPPEPVPDIGDIDLPDEILDEIDDMEVGVDPNDAAALAELQEAQAAFRASEKKKIWESLTRARMRIIGINDLQKIKRKSYMENFTENQPIEKAKHFLINKWPQNAAISLRIQQFPGYKPVTHAQPSTISDILSITANLFSDTETDQDLRLQNAIEHLKQLRMKKAAGYDSYLRLFMSVI
jgi:hypothetical protein